MSGLVVLPSFVSHDEQRQLVRWALRDHARSPNETNLDTHYILPEEGLWNRYASLRATGLVDEELVQPRASTSTAPPPEPPGPRKLVANEPAGKDNYRELATTPKPPSTPSSIVQPTSTASLIPRLRWANIGWSYHWGTKQYDFSKGKGVIQNEVRQLCKNVVRSVRWEQVLSDQCNHEEWGEDGPDWETWDKSYGQSASCSTMRNLLRYT